MVINATWYLQADFAIAVDIGVEAAASSIGGDTDDSRRLGWIICHKDEIKVRHRNGIPNLCETGSQTDISGQLGFLNRNKDKALN